MEESGFPDRVNFLHELMRGIQRGDDGFVMLCLVMSQLLPFAIFQPFLRRLIAANIKLPHMMRHRRESLRFAVDENFALFFAGAIANLFHEIVAAHGKANFALRALQVGMGEQMPLAQRAAQDEYQDARERAERPRERLAWEWSFLAFPNPLNSPQQNVSVIVKCANCSVAFSAQITARLTIFMVMV